MTHRPQTNRPLFRKVAIAGLSLALVSGIAACGDDDENADDPPTVELAGGEDGGTTGPKGSERPADTPDAAAVAAEACDAQVDLNTAVAGMPEDPAEIGPYPVSYTHLTLPTNSRV